MSPARFAAHAHRKFRRAGTGIFISAEGIFHNSVFQRMEGDDAEPSPGASRSIKASREFSNTSSSLCGQSDRLETFVGGCRLFPHLFRNHLRLGCARFNSSHLNQATALACTMYFAIFWPWEFIFSVVPDTEQAHRITTHSLTVIFL